MHKLERVLLALLTACVGFSLLKIPGSAFFTTVVGLTLSFYYFVGGFGICNNVPFKQIFKKKTISSLGALNIIWGQASGMFVYSMCAVAIVFAATNRPASHVFLTVAALNFVLALPIALGALVVQKSTIARDHVFRSIFFLLFLGALYYAVPKKQSYQPIEVSQNESLSNSNPRISQMVVIHQP